MPPKAQLDSNTFKNDHLLKECLHKDAFHITLGRSGGHVAKIQSALILLDHAAITNGDLSAQIYGKSTADAVLAYKRRKQILGPGQRTPDNIVGKLTITALDDDMLAFERTHPTPVVPPAKGKTHAELIADAFSASRVSLRSALFLLQRLSDDIDRADRTDGLNKVVAIQALARVHARNMAILSRRLLVSQDPLSREFRDALKRTRDLFQRNLDSSAQITEGTDGVGRCVGTPNAATTASDPEPRVTVCSPFFAGSDFLRRDVVTHEFFHLFLFFGDIPVPNTEAAFRNPNTLAQIVARLVDRDRQVNSDGHEPDLPPLPTP